NPAPDADIWSVTEPYFNWVVDAVANMLVEYAKDDKPTATYHRWYKWLNGDSTSENAAAVGELATNIFAGVEQMAQNASDVLAEVIDQITEPIKPKRARKTVAEKETKPAAKVAKTAKTAKTAKK
ncbi:MAG TPA: hypothetical protein PLQ88_34995, partial [Blastocatellia bacterium]|nr:hypothetical protein [Blastocatellia bacterium]